MSHHRKTRRQGAPTPQPPRDTREAGIADAPRPAAPPTLDRTLLLALTAEIEEVRQDLNARLDALAEKVRQLLDSVPVPAPVAPLDVRVGDRVPVTRLGGAFPVVEVAPDRQTVKVQAGTMRVQVRAEEIGDRTGRLGSERALEPAPPRRELDARIPELDLHGFSEQDALVTLDLFLHHCFAQRVGRVRIIHGKGTGILRAAVRQALAGHPLVLSLDSGPQFAGQDGVTLAELDL